LKVNLPTTANRAVRKLTQETASFLSEFQVYRALFDKLDSPTASSRTSRLLNIGREVRLGSRMWTKSHLELIAHWKQLHPLMLRIEMSDREVEGRLREAYSIREEDTRIDFMCRTPGIGPVLASLILTLTYPENYAPLELHAWNALADLGFNVTRKENSGGGFTPAEFSRYLEIVRNLANEANTTPWEISKGLHAINKVKTTKKWRMQLDHLTSSQSQLPPSSPAQEPILKLHKLCSHLKRMLGSRNVHLTVNAGVLKSEF
jgi:hypothetical protein